MGFNLLDANKITDRKAHDFHAFMLYASTSLKKLGFRSDDAACILAGVCAIRVAPYKTHTWDALYGGWNKRPGHPNQELDGVIIDPAD